MKNELLQMKQNLQDHYGVMMKECIKWQNVADYDTVIEKEHQSILSLQYESLIVIPMQTTRCLNK